GGRRLLARWRLVHRHAQRVLPRAERLFARHGGKTVFFGRFIAVLRITAAWMAGISHMPWWRFLAFNAAGGILWATLVGLVAYYLGHAAADAIQTYGLYAAGAIALGVVFVLVGVRWWERRMLVDEECRRRRAPGPRSTVASRTSVATIGPCGERRRCSCSWRSSGRPRSAARLEPAPPLRG